MSACWADYDNDGHQDVYVANMWSAAGKRVSEQPLFHPQAPDAIRSNYQRHASGNALYRNQGNGNFLNVGEQAGVAMGRWSWCSDMWDFDHDGYPDLYIANGYISAPGESDLGSFFWRQVVAKSPEDATPSLAYEHGWNALNELIRSDTSWSGHERNVLFANNRDGTFSEVSGALAMDFPEDSRSFALADLDHDGRLEVILKNRNAPQLRILHNRMPEIGHSIAFRLRGHKSNRDAIGTAITIEVEGHRQTKYLQAGSGFLAQHSKELFFGLGKPSDTALNQIHAKIQWPSGLTQEFANLPANTRVAIEEGIATFAATPFAKASAAYATPAAPATPEALPDQVETWLLEPIKAPAFALPDLTGAPHELSSFTSSFILLNFFSPQSEQCLDQLRSLQQNHSSLTAAQLKIIAINISESSTPTPKSSFPFPILIANEDTAALYNILYRYLFDRRRDLGFPTSFLIDKQGMIVKLYQGHIDPRRVLEDLKSIPTTPEARMQKAMPLGGVLYQGGFSRNDFTYGVALFQHGYLDQAADSFEQVVAAKPNDPEAYYNLGTLNLRRNKLAEAQSYLEQTVKLRPNYPEAWNNLGMLAGQQGHAEQAIEYFNRSLAQRPAYAIALLNLGNVYRRQGQYQQAEDNLNHALQLQPDDPEINYSLGMLYAQQKQASRATGYLQKAIALRPGYPEALNNLGVLLVQSQDYTQAEEQFKTCLRLNPDYDQSYFNLARLYVMQHDKPKAKQIITELELRQPDNPQAKQASQMLESMP